MQNCKILTYLPIFVTLFHFISRNVTHESVMPHKNCLVSRPLQIEKVMRACDFYSYFLSFLQGQIEIFERGIILHFAHIIRNVFLS